MTRLGLVGLPSLQWSKPLVTGTRLGSDERRGRGGRGTRRTRFPAATVSSSCALHCSGVCFQANIVEEHVSQCLLFSWWVGMDQKVSVAVGCGTARRRYGNGIMLVMLFTLCFLRGFQAQMLCIMAGMDQKDSSERHSFGFLEIPSWKMFRIQRFAWFDSGYMFASLCVGGGGGSSHFLLEGGPWILRSIPSCAGGFSTDFPHFPDEGGSGSQPSMMKSSLSWRARGGGVARNLTPTAGPAPAAETPTPEKEKEVAKLKQELHERFRVWRP